MGDTVQSGFEFVAAKPKGLRQADDEPRTVPMRPREVVQKNPTTDQKRVRRQMARQHRTATEIPTDAGKLLPGDTIRGPNNSVVKVVQVRLHKSDATKVMVDTEAGTLTVPRNQGFTVVPYNGRQQERPDMGPVPQSPTVGNPMAGNAEGPTSTSQTGNKCPVCGTNMQLRRLQGNSVYVCPRDGYSVSANGLGGTTSPDLLNNQRRSSMQTQAQVSKPEWGDMSEDEQRTHLMHGHGLNADMSQRGLDRAHDIAHQPGWVSSPSGEPVVHNHTHGALQTEADMRGKAGECRGCGGDLAMDAVDHSSSTVHAHCSDCGMEHQLQNANQHEHTGSKKWVAVTGLDPYITTTANTLSAVARRAQSVLDATKGSL